MILSGFSISKDFIAIERDSESFDLHNCFDFQQISYHVGERRAVLEWRRRKDEWVPANLPPKLSLVFEHVSLFKASERNADTPFSEDDCVDSIGFLWDDMPEQMAAFTANEPRDGLSHLCITFASDFSIKIAAGSARLVT